MAIPHQGTVIALAILNEIIQRVAAEPNS
jgi:hypothetical protein